MPDHPATVAELLLARADDDAPGLRFEDRTWSWGEVVAESARRAEQALALTQEARHRHVGVLLDNVPEYVFWLGGAALAGTVVVGINPTRRGRELAADIRHTECAAIVTDGAGAALLDGLDTGVGPEGLSVVGDVAGDATKVHGEPTPHDAAVVSPQTPFLLLFTSGTTGRPKAVRCGQGRLAAIASRAAELYDFQRDDVCYCPMPLFHGNAVMALWAPALVVGACTALSGRFSASRFLEDVRRHGATRFTYVGKALAYVLGTPERPDDGDNTLRIGFGTEASGPDRRRFEQRFGCQLVEGYGSSEGGIVINVTPDTPAGSLGRPAAGQDVIVCGPDGIECARAEMDQAGRLLNADSALGEIVNRAGPIGFEGYYADADTDAERLRQGWYWSGDLGYRDRNGFFYFAGRAGDWLRVDSENFAAAPIERVLERHPDVAAAAVYPVPDPVSGDRVMVALELRPGADFDAASLAPWLAAQPDLGTKWAPRLLRLLPRMPLTATGKVTKGPLRAEAWECADPMWWSPGRTLDYRLFTEADRLELRRGFEEHGRTAVLPVPPAAEGRRCLVIQHVEAEGPALIAAALAGHGISVEICQVFAADHVPDDLAGVDGLVVLGGPMSAVRDDGFPTRRAELSLLETALAGNVPVLGVCLGAQLLALAGGGEVFPGPAGPEIGWGEVSLSADGAGDALFGGLPPTMTVLHWHADTFRPGVGATQVASNERYRWQAFRVGDVAWGLQFHVEVDSEAARRMVKAFPHDARQAPGGAGQIEARAASEDSGLSGSGWAGRAVLGRYAALVASAPRRAAADVL